MTQIDVAHRGLSFVGASGLGVICLFPYGLWIGIEFNGSYPREFDRLTSRLDRADSLADLLLTTSQACCDWRGETMTT